MNCIKNISNAEYHQSEGMSKSKLFEMRITPEWFKYITENPKEPTPDMIFGIAFHTLVLEPEKFESEYAILPECDRRTKEGKAIYSEFLEYSGGKSVITQEDYNTICAMRDKLKSDPMAMALLSGAIEQSYYWTDELTGELCRCRPDCIPDLDTPIIVDLKSCKDVSNDGFMRDAIRFGYDLQAALYKEGVDLITGKKHDFVFVAVEKTPPYAINIFQADELFLKRGQEMFRTLLVEYAECKKTNNWYGHMGFANSINTLSLPRWIASEYE